jgi:hypothetical protein
MRLIYDCITDPDAASKYEKNLIRKITTDRDGAGILTNFVKM